LEHAAFWWKRNVLRIQSLEHIVVGEPAAISPRHRRVDSSAKVAGRSREPLWHMSVLLLRHVLFPAFSMRCGAPPSWRHAQGDPMLNEHQTLMILGWTLGTVCIGTLVLSALSMQLSLP
jgi:hypothetical protein